MNLTVKFESAELQFQQVLEDFFVAHYEEKYLFSHSLDHHRRVWKYAKELALLLSDENLLEDQFSADYLIIACYLHDIGMAIDPGIKHGRHSRNMCSRFLKENNLKESDFHDVLDAISNHDKKDYKDHSFRFNLLSILSVADDLDAFGFTGIYRYSEIYLTRGIDPHELGHLINDNASSRFDNFKAAFGFAAQLMKKHGKRFNDLQNFFEEYNKQVIGYQFGVKDPSGYCGIIEVFLSLLDGKKELKDIFMEPEKYSYDPVMKWFFSELYSDLAI